MLDCRERESFLWWLEMDLQAVEGATLPDRIRFGLMLRDPVDRPIRWRLALEAHRTRTWWDSPRPRPLHDLRSAPSR